jgi:diguanylate cyclase (GGDEF)-like protein
MHAQQFSDSRSSKVDLVAEQSMPTVENENARLEALERLDVLDTPPEEAFDRITRLARKLFDVPIAIVSFIDGHRQWYKSCVGPFTHAEVPSGKSFCRNVIDHGDPMVVQDASKDPRFARNPHVLPDPGVRFYAGVPLSTRDRHNVGTLCLVDFKPRDNFSTEQLDLLNDLAQMVTDELDLRVCATTDSLTGALSRRGFREEAGRATALALRHHQALSIVAVDIDHFKSINDTFGHPGGDLVLRRIVRSFFERLRETDLVGRLGGEEFAILLPNTKTNGAMEVAEKLRREIEGVAIEFGSKEIKVTASFGIASLDAATKDLDLLLANADKALCEAKASGRNRCVAFRAEATGEASPARRRVLKGGQILLNGRTSSIDCTVRSLSDEGAGIDVSSSVGIPKLFELAIKSDGFEKSCRVVRADEKHIEVAFV